MTLAQRLWTAVGLLIVILLVTTIVAMINVAAIGRNLERVSAVEQPASAAAYEMEINLSETSLALFEYVQTGSPVARARVLENRGRFRRHYVNYLGLRPKSRSLLERLDALAGELFHVGDTVLEGGDRLRKWRASGSSAEIVAEEEIMQAGIRRHVDLSEEIDNLLDREIQILAREQLALASAASAAKIERLQWVVTMLLVAGLLVAAWAIWQVGHGIVNPVRTLVAGANRIGRGELSHRISMRRADEIGSLASALDDMAANLEKERDAVQWAAQEIEQLGRQNELVLRSLAEGVYGLDPEGKANLVNPAAERMLGWSREEILGKPQHALVHHSKPDGSPYPVSESPIHASLHDGQTRLVDDEVFWRKDGTSFPVEYAVNPIREKGQIAGVVIAFHDVTREREAEQQRLRLAAESAARDVAEAARERTAFLSRASELLSSSLDYEKTLAHLAKMVVPFLADWCALDIVAADASIVRLAVVHSDPEKVELVYELDRQYPPDPGASRGVPNVIRTGKAELIPEITDQLLETTARDGRHLEIMRGLGLRSAMIMPLFAEGRAVGALTLVSAESGRTYASSDFEIAVDLARRASVAVERAILYRKAQESNRLKDDFLATLSHELRTPLTSILGWSRLLAGGDLDEETAQTAIDSINTSAKAQSQLIEDVLDISRIVTGKTRVEPDQIDLPDLLESAVETIRPTANAKSIAVTTDIDPSVPALYADPDRIRQVIWNLLTNAVKFSDKGDSVTVELRQVDSTAVIRFRDTGRGIRREFLPHIFETFRQEDSSSTRAHGGLGLGLSIVRHLVELHGGTIAAESEGPGKGSVFTVTLPVTAVQMGAETPEQRRVAREAVAAAPLPSLEGTRVLILDDIAAARQLVGTILRKAGAEVVEAETVPQALDLIVSFEPDVVVSDIAMPEQDGYDLVREVRKRESHDGPRRKMVALTAQGREQDRREILEAGFDEYLRKPIEPSELVDAIAALGR